RAVVTQVRAVPARVCDTLARVHAALAQVRSIPAQVSAVRNFRGLARISGVVARYFRAPREFPGLSRDISERRANFRSCRAIFQRSRANFDRRRAKYWVLMRIDDVSAQFQTAPARVTISFCGM